jgi:SAM-dependent methyltransferase
MTEREIIAAAYDEGVEQEYRRLQETPLTEYEFWLISQTITRLTPPGGCVIDIGAGPGRYAEHLLGQGYRVGLVDLSAASLKAFSDRLAAASTNVLFNRVACATALDWIPDGIADTVLLMGPMYHLTREADQLRALGHCHRILKDGGNLVVVFLSPFGQLFCQNKLVPVTPGTAEQTSRLVTQTHFGGHDVPQFRCSPDHAQALLEREGFRTATICNIEGMASYLSPEELGRYRDRRHKQSLFRLLRATGERRELRGKSHQFLVTAQKF